MSPSAECVNDIAPGAIIVFGAEAHVISPISFHEVIERTPRTVTIADLESVTADRSDPGSRGVLPDPERRRRPGRPRRCAVSMISGAPIVQTSRGGVAGRVWDGQPVCRTYPDFRLRDSFMPDPFPS